MFALHNACERSAQEWKDLFTTVDPRFCIKEMYPVWPDSYQKFIHVTLES